MKYFTKEVRIGLAGLIALSVLIYGINYLKGIYMFQPSNYFYAHFENANGLTKSSPVFADGVRVGIVRNIDYDYNKPGNVTVEVELDTELRIPKGSCAELETELMGGVKMNILLANNPREKYQVGDTIPGLVNSGMMASVNKLLPQVERMLPKVDSVLIALNAILTNKSIPATLGSIEKTTANLAVVSHQLKGIVGKDIPQLTQKLNIIGDNFVVISDNLKTIDYAGTFEKIDSTLSNVKLITDKLQSKDNSVGLLLNSPDLYHNLNSTAANASLLLEDLKANPKRYVHFSLFGKKNK